MDLLFSQYFTELIAVISITILTVVAPGPDFVIVVRNSLTYSRRAGICTALGVSTAVWIHIFYTLAGIGFILSQSILLFSVIKMLGSAYLMYLGISCLRNTNGLREINTRKNQKSISDFQSFKMGFINNALNPKATLFFVSLFTQLVSPETPLSIQLLYGAIASFSCLSWFSLVAIFLNRAEVKQVFFRIQKPVERLMGAVLIAFSIKVALSTSN
ncbi:MAG: LysE family translocator [Desulfobulbus sp.]|nr:MAG: LysE family translocator [Desulfobulbus sp.]